MAQQAYRSKAGVNDLILLNESEISNAGIVQCLNSHFSANEIYVWIGATLISVNPYRMVPGMYDTSTLRKYPGKNEHQNAPHVYAIAERAYKKMVQELGRECVIISGESGAGKTEASKRVMEYIAAVSSKAKAVENVKKQLLESNPLLEAFGNAKTVRNNNSSRFGKFMQILFDVADPVGGRIQVYLLEKNRVITRQEGERSFHIFYQLLAGASQADRQQLGLGSASPGDYAFLAASKCDTVQGMNDAEEWAHTTRAMGVCGFDAAQQADVRALVAAALLLGNVTFSKKGGDGSQCSDVSQVASLLHVDAAALADAITHKLIRSGTETVQTPLSVADAMHARDSLAKGIYSRLFEMIVSEANKAISAEFFSSTIGVLDIYGFEVFGTNSFEQLCINYTNEKLQQLFIELTLRAEQAEYAAEGIEWESVDYYDNLPICRLIEAKGQIFSLLDEESIFPSGTDASLYSKLSRVLASAKRFSLGAAKGTGRLSRTSMSHSHEFIVEHYAGNVQYTCRGMLDKNKDLLDASIVGVVSSSGHGLVAAMFAADAARVAASNKRPVTSCMQFKSSVQDLMATLSSMRQHYIRCIKPNDDKRAGVFEAARVEQQVKYLGLLENVKVRRAGYAYRLPYAKFVSLFKSCAKRHVRYAEDFRATTEEILKGHGFRDYVLGKTKVFIRSPETLFALEALKTKFLAEANALFQTVVKTGENVIWADLVVCYDQDQKPGDVTLCLSAQSLYIFNAAQKVIQHIAVEQLLGISIGAENAKVDGFMVLHCSPPLGKNGQPKADAQPFDVLVENVFKATVLEVCEALKNAGVVIDVRQTAAVPSSADPNFVPLKGTTKKRKKGCVLM